MLMLIYWTQYHDETQKTLLEVNPEKNTDMFMFRHKNTEYNIKIASKSFAREVQIIWKDSYKSKLHLRRNKEEIKYGEGLPPFSEVFPTPIYKNAMI
jgi:hypothetical protein